MDTFLGIVILISVVVVITALTIYSRNIINMISEKKYTNLREIQYNRSHGRKNRD